MKFTLENTRGIHIHSYQPGELILKLPTDDVSQPHRRISYHSSLILSNPDSVDEWAIRHVNELALHHFQLAWQNKPEIVLFGSGQRMAFPAHEIRQEFANKGIGFEAMDTSAACRTYNVLLAEGRDVMAWLIID